MKKIFCLAGLAFMFTACEKEEEDTTPYYAPSIFTITQQPGQRLTFNFEFSAERENMIIVQKAGQVILSKNIDDSGALTPFEIDYNTSGTPVSYEITHKFKLQRGASPWLNGTGRVDTVNNEEITYRFDDRDPVDEDYNDAVVKVIREFKK